MKNRNNIKNCFLIIIVLLSGSFLTAQVPDGYYDGLEDLEGDGLKLALHEIIKGHLEFPYSDSGTDIWDILKETDRDTANPENVILLYTGRSVNADQEYNNGQGWNREHVWAKSHGGFDEDDGGPGTDAHHLRPSDISVNSSRGNKDFDNGGTQHSEATECFTDGDSWEARDAVKGDIARMIFYMATRYEGNGEIDLEVVDAVNTSPNPTHGKLSALLQWHKIDPVDDFERNRNDVIYSYQGNRNPFVDHPEFVERIWDSGLLAPSSLEYTMVTDHSVDLKWLDNSPNESGYRIYRDSSLIATTVPNITEYEVTDLEANTTYYFSVAAFNDYEETGQVGIYVTTLSGEIDTSRALFISEYIEGSSYNKAIELFNPCDTVVDLSKYSVKLASNGGGWGNIAELSGNLDTMGTWVIYHASADSAISSRGDLASSSVINFNGNDAIGLFYNDQLIDLIGNPDLSPGDGWDVAGISEATKDHTLIRKARTLKGATHWIVSAGTDAGNSQWVVQEKNYFEDLGIHSIDTTENAIRGDQLIAAEFILHGAFPNPFNPETNIAFEISKPGLVTLEIYDILGNKLETLLHEHRQRGYHQIIWQAGQYPSGVYFYKLSGGTFYAVNKCLLIK